MYPHSLIFTAEDPDRPFILPTRAHDTDCGYDMFVDGEYIIPPGEDLLIGHNLRSQLPPETWGLVIGRSSNWRRKLEVGLGVIDNGYRGPLFARALNLSDDDIKISQGDRVAQLILVPMFTPPVKYVDSLDDSDRGDAGFGSTGK